MLDARLLRENPQEVRQRLALRGFVLDVECWQALEAARKEKQVKVETMRGERRRLAKAIGLAKGGQGDEEALWQEAESLKGRLEEEESTLTRLQIEIESFLLDLPNLPHPSVPPGKDENDNVEIRRFGVPREFAFDPKDHVAIAESLGLLDFDAAAKMSGARFSVLYGDLARLHRVLGQFMLDRARQKGYLEAAVPYLVQEQALIGTGQLPKFAQELFFCAQDGKYLIPTAEVPLTNLARERIFAALELPKKFCALTPCFRREAGAAGKDTRGLIRQHQFDKVELVRLTTASRSQEELEELTSDAASVLEALDLPYRVVCLCAGDLGFAAAKTYDLEVWLPSQGRFREVSSCSNFEAFQARRLQARVRGEEGKTEPIHTLNGSGLAVGRTLVALLENHQREDGSVFIPLPLRPYLGGMEALVRGKLS